jgi:membrane protein DedA with SNARE-associated domain
MSDQILAALALYGEPALFVVAVVASIGIPLPVMLLLIVAGSLAAQGTLNFGVAVAVATVGSVAGDQIGYAIGRRGGHVLVGRLTRLIGGADRLAEIEARAQRWGGPGVFFSRWLLTPLGPWVNLASGLADYSWLRFTLWDVAGEAIYAALYIGFGLVFSDRVQELQSILGDLTWAFVAILAAGIIGWKLFAKKAAAKPSASQPV